MKDARQEQVSDGVGHGCQTDARTLSFASLQERN